MTTVRSAIDQNQQTLIPATSIMTDEKQHGCAAECALENSTLTKTPIAFTAKR